MTPAGFPHSEIPGSQLGCQLPGLIAGSYVLHRLLVPRHPPCALSSLSCYKDARVHCVVLKLRAVPPSSPALTARTSRPSRQFAERMVQEIEELDPSGPNSAPGILRHSARGSTPAVRDGATVLTSFANEADQIVDVPLVSWTAEERMSSKQADGHQALCAWCQVLLRKEVIQPHLPVRLPCYDFVPIASPTFDGSLHKGWATGFGCCRLS